MALQKLENLCGASRMTPISACSGVYTVIVYIGSHCVAPSAGGLWRVRGGGETRLASGVCQMPELQQASGKIHKCVANV